jgi:hypothetical protein
MNNTPEQNRISAARRAADKRKRAESTAAVQAAANLPPEYLDKLRHDCLVAANARRPGASPEEVTREAARDLEGRLRFLTEKDRSTTSQRFPVKSS